MSHAILSPSAAFRWINCPPSARLEKQFPDTSGEAAREGTLAHSLSELIIKFKLKRIKKQKYQEQLIFIMADILYNDAMFEYCDDFAIYVLEQYNEARKHTKDALIFLEQKLDLTSYVPEGFGTGDVVIIADHMLTIIDLKYGKGVRVEAVNNSQMKLYGLGALKEHDFLYDIELVRMTIYQPRLDNISTDEITTLDLDLWADNVLRPAAKLAFEGKGEFNPGKHCQFCKVKASCKANAGRQMELAKFDFAEPILLTDAEVSEILGREKEFQTWLKAVTEHALTEAVSKGKKWPGYKLVTGKSNRVYADENKVADKLISSGLTMDTIYIQKLIGITELEKKITKPKFNDLLEGLIIKPTGKPTLVHESDKRDEIGSAASARREFEDVNN